ncbi:MAG: adenylosuccinate lyase, partial [Methylophilaceae bacterium]
MELTPLNALSPLDGRYQSKVDPLRACFSEYALIRYRALVEVEWLKALAAEPALQEIAPFSASTLQELDA